MPDTHPHALVARAFWDAVAEADAAVLDELLGPDVEWHVLGSNRISGDYAGTEQVLSYLAHVGELADDLSSSMRELFVGHDGAVIAFTVDARRGDRTLRQRLLLRLRISDGRIREAWSVPLDQRAGDEFWA